MREIADGKAPVCPGRSRTRPSSTPWARCSDRPADPHVRSSARTRQWLRVQPELLAAAPEVSRSADPGRPASAADGAVAVLARADPTRAVKSAGEARLVVPAPAVRRGRPACRRSPRRARRRRRASGSEPGPTSGRRRRGPRNSRCRVRTEVANRAPTSATVRRSRSVSIVAAHRRGAGRSARRAPWSSGQAPPQPPPPTPVPGPRRATAPNSAGARWRAGRSGPDHRIGRVVGPPPGERREAAGTEPETGRRGRSPRISTSNRRVTTPVTDEHLAAGQPGPGVVTDLEGEAARGVRQRLARRTSAPLGGRSHRRDQAFSTHRSTPGGDAQPTMHRPRRAGRAHQDAARSPGRRGRREATPGAAVRGRPCRLCPTRHHVRSPRQDR